jgi:hypothetical protein
MTVKKTKKKYKRQKYLKTKKSKFKSKSKKNHKSQLGGSVDRKFAECYERNLEKIRQALTQYSGKHSIDITNSNLFINNQLSEVRRQAAKDLIENTIYISLEDVYKIVEQLIVMIYGMPEIQNATTIYIYSGNMKKSFYFLSVLALFFIRDKGYKEPIFIGELSNELFDEIDSNPLIILDDSAYSGSQLSNMINNIYYDRVVVKKLKPPNLFIALLALNDFSKQRLEKVPSKRNKYGTMEETISPFKLVYLPDRLYKPIISIIGLERYFYINYFFSIYTQDTPYISLYFDHKIADDISTYKKPLLYGPIVPSDYTPTNVIRDTNEGMEEYDIISNELYKNIELTNSLIQQFLNENKEMDQKYLKYMDISKNRRGIVSSIIAKILLDKLSKTDICEKNVTTISFHPIINTCNITTNLIRNIHDNEIINYKYLLFMAPEGCLEGKDCAVRTEMIPESVKTVNNIKISNKINSVICPHTWYKNGALQMTCI